MLSIISMLFYVCLKAKSLPAEGDSYIYYFKINNYKLVSIYDGIINFLEISVLQEYAFYLINLGEITPLHLTSKLFLLSDNKMQ